MKNSYQSLPYLLFVTLIIQILPSHGLDFFLDFPPLGQQSKIKISVRPQKQLTDIIKKQKAQLSNQELDLLNEHLTTTINALKIYKDSKGTPSLEMLKNLFFISSQGDLAKQYISFLNIHVGRLGTKMGPILLETLDKLVKSQTIEKAELMDYITHGHHRFFSDFDQKTIEKYSYHLMNSFMTVLIGTDSDFDKAIEPIKGKYDLLWCATIKKILDKSYKYKRTELIQEIKTFISNNKIDLIYSNYINSLNAIVIKNTPTDKPFDHLTTTGNYFFSTHGHSLNFITFIEVLQKDLPSQKINHSINNFMTTVFYFLMFLKSDPIKGMGLEKYPKTLESVIYLQNNFKIPYDQLNVLGINRDLINMMGLKLFLSILNTKEPWTIIGHGFEFYVACLYVHNQDQWDKSLGNYQHPCKDAVEFDLLFTKCAVELKNMQIKNLFTENFIEQSAKNIAYMSSNPKILPNVYLVINRCQEKFPYTKEFLKKNLYWPIRNNAHACSIYLVYCNFDRFLSKEGVRSIVVDIIEDQSKVMKTSSPVELITQLEGFIMNFGASCQ